jgi:hypothetical protein
MVHSSTSSALSAASPGILKTKNSFRFWKNFLVSSMLLFVTLLPEYSEAQTTLTIGTSTSTSSRFPLYTCYGYNYSQQTFLASEIVAAGATSGTAGYISSIGFYASSISASSFSSKCKDWVVYMGNTTKSTFSSSSDWVPYSSLTEVYDGTVTPSGTGWFTITFPTAFYWDGSSNIVIAIDENTSDYYCTAYFRATSRSGTRGLLYYNDYSNPDPTSPPTANYTSGTIANLQLGYTPATPCSGTVTGGTTTASATTICPGASVSFSVSGSTGGTGLTYTWDTSATGTGSWGAITGATGTSLTFTPPSGRTLYYRRNITCTSSSSTASSSVVSVSSSSPLTVPYTEDFESTTVGNNVACAEALSSFSTGATTYYGTHYWKLISGTYSSGGSNHTAGGSNYMVASYYIGSYSGNPPGYWFTPGIELQSGKTYRMSYWYRVSGYMASYYPAGADFGMYYSTSQTTSGLTAVKPDLTGMSSATYDQTSGDFSVPSDGVYYLAVKINNNGYGYYGGGMFDDLNLVELPPCNTATTSTFATGGISAASPSVICGTPGTTTLSLTGTPAFSGLSFQWESATGTATSFSNITGGTTATYNHTISSGGKYYFRCKVTCASTGISKYSDTVEVKTTPITPPYFEDFETANVPANVPCASYYGYWPGSSPGYYLGTSTAGTPGSTVQNHTPGGNKLLLAGTYCGTYGYGYAFWWFSPGLSLTAGKAYDVSFWFKSANVSSSYASRDVTLGIGFGGSQTPTAMTSIGDTTVKPSGTSSSWTQFKRGFVSSSTSTQYIGIKFDHSYYMYYGTNIDDIGVEQLPPCSALPTAGIASASPNTLCTSSATSKLTLLGVSAASDLQFQWQKSTTGLPGSWTNISGATLPGYTTPTPAAHMFYRCYVVCPLIAAPNADTSSAVEVKTTPITPPYFEDFETGTAGVNMPCAGYTYSWSSGSYWYLRDGDFSSYYTAITNHTPGGSKYIHAGYYLGSYGSGNTEYWFTPQLALTAKKAYNVSYWINGSGYSGGNTLTGVAVGTAQTASAMTIAAGADTTLNTTSYKQINRAFISPSTGNYYVGIKVNNLVYSYPGVAIDDIGVNQLPPCSGKPSAGAISSKPSMICTTGSATLSLPGASMASDLDFQWYDVTSGTPVLIAGATAPSYTTPTLSSTKKYICVLKCLASAAPNTDTSSVYTLNVGALTPPYRETFETTTIGTNVTCAGYTYTWASYAWNTYGSPFSSSYPAIKNHTPGGSNYLMAGYYLGYYASGAHYWFTPRIAFTAGDTYEFSYWYSGSGYSSGNTTLGMYYGTSQTASAMTTPIRPDLTGVNTSTYKQVIGRFIAPATANYYIGVKVQHTAYSYPGIAIDDIGLDQLPPCTGAPTVGAVESTPSMLCSSGTVKLDMDLAGVSKVSGLTYRWEYDDDATFASPLGSSAALASPTYTTPTLSSTTWARCIVKCTATGDSTISSTVKVDVGAVVPPYIEDFEKSTPGVNVPCASYTYSFGQYYYWNTMGSPMTYGPSVLDNHTKGGSKYLIGGYYIGYYSGSPEYWFSPAIKFTAGKLYQLSYWHKSDAYSGATYTIDAYLGASQTAAAMTTPIGSSVTPTGKYTQFKNRFTATSTANLYIGFKKSQSGFGYGIAIDDIGLQEVPPCSAPVVAGTIFAEPFHVCAVGGGTTLDLTGTTLATGLTFEWLSSTSPSGPYTATGGTAVPYATDPLVQNTWFKVVVKCTATGATDTSDALKVGVGAFEIPYAEDFESVSAGDRPVCSDATYWGLYDYDGFKVKSDPTYAYAYNHTPGGSNYLAVGYYLGYYGYYTPLTDDNFWFTPGLKLDARYKYKFNYWYVGSSNSVVKISSYYGKSQSPTGMTIPLQSATSLTGSYELYDTVVKPATTGVYYFGLRKTNSPLGDYYYTNVGFDDINVDYAPCDGTPFVGITTSANPSNTALCTGTPVQLVNTGSTIKLVPGIKHQWQRKPIGGAGPFVWTAVAGATDTLLSADTLVGYEYRLAVICSNTNDSIFSAPFLIPALPPHPSVAINPTTTPVTYCLGDSVRFNATNFTGAVYDWMIDSVVIPGWKFSDMGATEPGTYMVRVQSALSPCPAWSNKVILIANDPGYTVNITKPADSIICAGNSMTLTATTSKAGLTYQWRKDNIDIPGATSATYVVTTGGYYRVMAYDGISICQAASRNIKITVKPNPPAVISVPGGTLTACEEDGVLLAANTGGFSYEWRRGGSPIVGWTDSNQLIKNSGVYSVEVRTPEGCASVSSPVTVNILPSPKPVITKSGLTLGTVLTFVNYQWIRNGVDMPGETSPTLSLTMHGIYQVRVNNGNDCQGTSNPIEIMDQGLNVGNVSVSSDVIRIYPNPATSTVFIQSPVPVRVSVKDVTGRTVIEEKLTNKINLEKLADGIYLFIVNDINGKQLMSQQRISKVTKK